VPVDVEQVVFHDPVIPLGAVQLLYSYIQGSNYYARISRAFFFIFEVEL
jgi:hypothetical protein